MKYPNAWLTNTLLAISNPTLGPPTHYNYTSRTRRIRMLGQGNMINGDAVVLAHHFLKSGLANPHKRFSVGCSAHSGAYVVISLIFSRSQGMSSA